MIQNVLRDIGGIAIYGVVSVCLFFTVFGVAVWHAFRVKASFVESMSSLPMEADDGRQATPRVAGGGEKKGKE